MTRYSSKKNFKNFLKIMLTTKSTRAILQSSNESS